MRNFIKPINKRHSFLFSAVIAAAFSITACTSPADANNKTSSELKQSNAANVSSSEPAKNKPTVNNAEPEQTPLIEVYDGRKSDLEAAKPTKSEEEMVEKEFRNKESLIKQKFGEAYCSDEDAGSIGISGAAKGSFTKPDSAQKAYFYEICRSGSSHFGVGGIIIFENEKAVAHYVYGENGLDNDLFSLSDINKNGLSELVLINGSTHQGYTNGGITIIEFKDGNLEVLGGASTYESNDGAAEDEAKIETKAYKISVQPSAKPVFFRETYVEKGAGKWSLTKKSEKITLDKDTFGKNYKVS